MLTIEPTYKLGDLVAKDPRRARLFEQLRLEYCSGGQRTLEEACVQRGLDPETVVAVLNGLHEDSTGSWSQGHGAGPKLAHLLLEPPLELVGGDRHTRVATDRELNHAPIVDAHSADGNGCQPASRRAQMRQRDQEWSLLRTGARPSVVVPSAGSIGGDRVPTPQSQTIRGNHAR